MDSEVVVIGEESTTMSLLYIPPQSLTTVFCSYTVTPHQRKLLFATDGDCYRKTQPVRMQSENAELQSPGPVDTSTKQSPEAQGTLPEKRQKDDRSQSTMEFAVRLCLLVRAEATPIRSHQHDSRTPVSTPIWMERSP